MQETSGSGTVLDRTDVGLALEQSAAQFTDVTLPVYTGRGPDAACQPILGHSPNVPSWVDGFEELLPSGD